jgi:hypothetical protein
MLGAGPRLSARRAKIAWEPSVMTTYLWPGGLSQPARPSLTQHVDASAVRHRLRQLVQGRCEESTKNTRSLPAAAQPALRTRAVRAVLGHDPGPGRAGVRGHPNAVNRWVKRYPQGGWAGLSARRRGRRAGEQAALTRPSSRRSSRWSARRPRTSWGWRSFWRSGVVAGRDGGALGCGGWAFVGASGPDPGHQGDRQALSGQHAECDLQRRPAAVPLVHRVFTAAVFIDFLGRLLRDCGGRKVHLIVDGHPFHRAKLVSAWVGRHAERIELHFCPATARSWTR